MLVATWNVNSINARLPLLEEFLRKRKPDIISLQETKVEDRNFPVNFFLDMGYNCVFKGQKGYNGVAIASKFEIDEIEKNFEWIEGEEKRIIMVEIEGMKIMNAYFPHGKVPYSPSYESKLEFVRKMKEYVEKFMEQEFMLMGDFNIAMDDIDVYQPDIMKYSIGFTDEERKALRELYETGFVDLFRLHNKNEGEYTWWDYRANSFKRNAGMRIDYIWATPLLARKCVNAYIDREMRAKPHPSDHAPLLASFNARGRI